jgi:hypothetical protein
VGAGYSHKSGVIKGARRIKRCVSVNGSSFEILQYVTLKLNVMAFFVLLLTQIESVQEPADEEGCGRVERQKEPLMEKEWAGQ